jgi:hypothetical protein
MGQPHLVRECNTAAARLSACAAGLRNSNSRILSSLAGPVAADPQRRRILLTTVGMSAPLSTAAEQLGQELSRMVGLLAAGHNVQPVLRRLLPLLQKARRTLESSVRFSQVQRESLRRLSRTDGGIPAGQCIES